jgi:hypothetical protein
MRLGLAGQPDRKYEEYAAIRAFRRILSDRVEQIRRWRAIQEE